MNKQHSEKSSYLSTTQFLAEGREEEIKEGNVQLVAFVLSYKHRRKTVVIWHSDSYIGKHMVAHASTNPCARTMFFVCHSLTKEITVARLAGQFQDKHIHALVKLHPNPMLLL